jgi:hypothetical protein
MNPSRLLLAAASCLAVLFAAGCGGTKSTVWQNTIETGADEIAADIASDGSDLYVAGTVVSKSSPDHATWLLQKLTRDGKVVWGQTYPGNEYLVVGDIAVDPAGSVYAACRSVQKGKQVCVTVKCGASAGNVVWQKGMVVGDQTSGMGVCLLSGDRIAVCGTAGTEQNADHMVAVLNAKDGQTIWAKNYDLCCDDVLVHIASDSKDYMVAVGQVASKDNADIVVIKLNPQGDTLWTRVYDSGGEDKAGEVAFDPIGNVIVTGTAFLGDSTRCVILEYDPDGGVIRKAAYGEQAQAEGHALYITPGADIFVAGKLLSGNTGSMLAFQYRPGAKSVWERTLKLDRPGEADAIYVDGDVYIAGTVDNKKTKDIVVARLHRPVLKPAPIPTR